MGIPSKFILPPQSEPNPTQTPKQNIPVKWCMRQDFGGINKVTEIALVPQGDIRAKQLRLSGHRYVHVFNFAAGFYGISVHPDSQPFITFFVEGRGYFAYQCIVTYPAGVHISNFMSLWELMVAFWMSPSVCLLVINLLCLL